MPLDRFVATLDAVEQVEARERTAFVSDLSAVAAGMFSKKGGKALQEHLNLLAAATSGGFGGNSEQ
jgi:hypothetical protein